MSVKMALIELAERTAEGTEVRLLWHRDGGNVVLRITDGETSEVVECEVPPGEALEAFRRPFVYVSSTDARMVAPDLAGPAGPASGFHRAA
jgi:hypothetical protein